MVALHFLITNIPLSTIINQGQFSTTSSKTKVFVQAYFSYLFVGILCVVVMLLVDLILIKLFQQPSIRSSHYSSDQYLSNTGLIKGVFIITIGAPIIEELAFRLFLKPRSITITLSTFFLVFVLIDSFLVIDDVSLHVKRIIICLLLSLTIYIFYKEIWGYYIERHQKTLLIVSSVIFGLVHINNFDPLYPNLWFLYPFYITPQIVLGLIAGWLRIHLGFVWAVALHILVNGTFIWHKLFEY